MLKDLNKIITIFLIIIIAICAVFQVIILNRYSTSGEELVIYLEKIKEVEKENNRLTQRIASASAIATIYAKAKEFGLTNNQQVVFLSAPLPLAFFQKSSL